MARRPVRMYRWFCLIAYVDENGKFEIRPVNDILNHPNMLFDTLMPQLNGYVDMDRPYWVFESDKSHPVHVLDVDEDVSELDLELQKLRAQHIFKQQNGA